VTVSEWLVKGVTCSNVRHGVVVYPQAFAGLAEDQTDSSSTGGGRDVPKACGSGFHGRGPPPKEQEASEGQPVGGDDPPQIGLGKVKLHAYGGKRGVDDREIHDGHEEGHH
jgi:hypothetical protein